MSFSLFGVCTTWGCETAYVLIAKADHNHKKEEQKRTMTMNEKRTMAMNDKMHAKAVAYK